MNEAFSPTERTDLSPEEEIDLENVLEVARRGIEDEAIQDKIVSFAEHLKTKHPHDYQHCALYHKLAFSSALPGAKLFWDFEGEDSIARFARTILGQSMNEGVTH